MDSCQPFADPQRGLCRVCSAGAGRGMIIGQFLMETIVLALLCLPLTFGLLEGIIPFFNQEMGVQLQVRTLWQPAHLGLFLAITSRGKSCNLR